MRSTLLALALACAPAVAHADQCIDVDPDTAAAAAKLLKDATVVAYCAPCNDSAPSGPSRPKVERAARSVKLDGKEVDLAYTYVQTGKSTFTNVGLMVGCGATGVPGFIDPAKLARKPASKPAASKQPCDPFSHMHGCDR